MQVNNQQVLDHIEHVVWREAGGEMNLNKRLQVGIKDMEFETRNPDDLGGSGLVIVLNNGQRFAVRVVQL